MQAPLETDALVQQNLRTRSEVEAWVEAQKKAIREEKREDERRAQEQLRQTHDAQRRRETLQQQQHALTAGVLAKEREVGAHQVEIEVLQAEKSKKEPVAKELFNRTLQQDTRLKELLAESERLRTAQEHQVGELRQGIALYERLGLVFDHSEAGRVTVRFTQIDPANPAREFSFRMTIDLGTDRYLVDACSEAVPALGELVMRLNAGGDLPLFVRAMRRQFKQLV